MIKFILPILLLVSPLHAQSLINVGVSTDPAQLSETLEGIESQITQLTNEVGALGIETSSGSAFTGFWAQLGTNIYNTNSGYVNLIGGASSGGNIVSLQTSSTAWDVSFQNYAGEGGQPTLSIDNTNHPGLVWQLIDTPGGQRMMLWPPNVHIDTLSVTGILPTAGFYGDVPVGDIYSLGIVSWQIGVRYLRGTPYTACTNIWSSYSTITGDQDYGPTINLCPDAYSTGGGAVNDGYESFNAWGIGTGPLANGFRWQNRANSSSFQSLAQLTSVGWQQQIGGVSVTGSQASQIANSIFMDESAGAGQLAAVGTGSAYAPMQLISTNGSGGTHVIVSIDGGNQLLGIDKGTPQSTLDVQGTASFGTTTQSTFTANGSLNLPAAATITDSANIINSVLATSNGAQYTTVPLLGAGGIIIGTNLFPSSGTVTGSNGILITTATAPSSINVANSQNLATNGSPTFAGVAVAGGADTNMILEQSSDFTHYNIASVNGNITFEKGAGIFGGASTDNQLYLVSPSSVTFVANGVSVGEVMTNGNFHLGTTAGTQVYRCSGGTTAGELCYGNACPASVCTTGGGSFVGTGVYLP